MSRNPTAPSLEDRHRYPAVSHTFTVDATATLVFGTDVNTLESGEDAIQRHIADHSFHVLARSGENDGEVMREILDAFAAWIGEIGAA